MSNRSPSRVEMEHWKLVRLFYPNLVKVQQLPDYLSYSLNSRIEEILAAIGRKQLLELAERYSEFTDEQEFYMAVRVCETIGVYLSVVELASVIKIKTTYEG